jgi:hypothetical protein
MAESDQSLEGLSSEERKKVQELMQKDAKAERRVRGPWLWLTSLLGASMVLIYFYGAGFQALDTQYHLGVYVLITFVLVFLLYPAGGRFAVGAMSVWTAAMLAVWSAVSGSSTRPPPSTSRSRCFARPGNTTALPRPGPMTSEPCVPP